MTVQTQPTMRLSRRRQPLVGLYAANVVSGAGDVLMFLAVPWFVLQTTGSVAQTGITAFFSTASVALSAVLGSAIVDRLGFQRASVVSDVASMLGVALIPLLYATVGLPFGALLALVFIAGLLTTPGATARSSLIPDLSRLAGVRLERATAAADGMTRLSRFVGAPLAGILIVVIGTSNLLWIDAATFAFSALAVALAVPARLAPQLTAGDEPPAPQTAEEREPVSSVAEPSRGYFARLAGGFVFLWRDPWLRGATLVVLVTNMLDAGQSGVLAPAFVKQVYGNAAVLGALIAAFGGAAFAGTIAFGAVGHRLPRGLTLGVSYTLGGASRFFWIVLLAPHPVAMIAVQAVCGFFIGQVNPLYDTIAYERVPAAMRARVFGAQTAGAMLGAPLGGLIAGLLAPTIGVEPSMLVFGVIYAAATLSLLVHPSLRLAGRSPSH